MALWWLRCFDDVVAAPVLYRWCGDGSVVVVVVVLRVSLMVFSNGVAVVWRVVVVVVVSC